MVDSEKLLREMHSNIAVLVERVENLDEKVEIMDRRITTRQDVTNNNVAKLKEQTLRQEGATTVLKYLVAVTLSALSAGAAVAGVIIAVITLS